MQFASMVLISENLLAISKAWAQIMAWLTFVNDGLSKAFASSHKGGESHHGSHGTLLPLNHSRIPDGKSMRSLLRTASIVLLQLKEMLDARGQ
ncbi:hypothetical protein [Rhizobium lusitanum]|uniref:Uncharacterized protein n=1 Tax=Rhizobium lusitanum TaxID=293958 RepID=A0A7X0MG27_9HYPH|nr:hypothetical protein [Rhizobium lusitanum]MBB6489399.1 hypothetical protein [Rhizobium lusitanum]